MKYLIPISLLLLTSCVTTKKVEKYLAKNPELIEKVFIYEDIHDTTLVVKDSLIVERLTDTLYQWFTENHYIDRVKIKKILEPCKDSILIVEKRIFVDRYKKAYELAKKDSEYNDKAFRWWRKGALLTWGWIILIGGVIYIIKRR